MAGNFEYALRSLMAGFTPIRHDGTCTPTDIAMFINPLNMNRGRYFKLLLYAGIASKIRKKFVKVPFEKVPFVGRYIS